MADRQTNRRRARVKLAGALLWGFFAFAGVQRAYAEMPPEKAKAAKPAAPVAQPEPQIDETAKPNAPANAVKPFEEAPPSAQYGVPNEKSPTPAGKVPSTKTAPKKLPPATQKPPLAPKEPASVTAPGLDRQGGKPNDPKGHAPTLTLRPLWDGRSLKVGTLDPRLDQIALRGPLAIVPVNGNEKGVQAIDARKGEVIRTWRAPGAAPTRVSGVLLDGEDIVFATDGALAAGAGDAKDAKDNPGRGLIAKAHLDGTYVWLSGRIGSPQALPVLIDLDRDGTRDVVVVTSAPDEVSAWNGATGEPLWRTALTGCDTPQLRAVELSSTAALAVYCHDGSLQLLNAGDGAPTRIARSDLRGTLVQIVQRRPLIEGTSLEPWQWLAMLGYNAAETPERTETCYVATPGEPCDSTTENLTLTNQGAIAGGLLDEGRYGALVVGSNWRSLNTQAPIVGTLSLEVSVRGSSYAETKYLKPEATDELFDAYTVSADDLDGDGHWDLLVACRDGALRAYATNGKGFLYQGLPHGDLYGTGMPPSEYATIESARRDTRELEAWRSAAADAPDAAFAPLRDPAARTLGVAGHDRRVSLLAGTVQDAPIATYWPEGDTKNPLARPLLDDARGNSKGLFAHDGAALYFLPRGTDGFRLLALPKSDAAASTRIAGLAVGENAVLLARGGRLIVCGADGSQCKSSYPVERDERAVTAVAPGIDPGTFWVAFDDASIDRYNGKLQPAAKARAGAIELLTEVRLEHARALIASGAHVAGPSPEIGGTLAYPVQTDGELGEPVSSTVELQQVLRCSDRAPLYARSHGALLESSAGLAGFGKTRGAPSGVRALACATDGGLVLLSAEQCAFALAGPPRFWSWAFPLAFGLVALGLLGQGVLGGRKRQLPPPEHVGARNVIVPEEPLERLPDDRSKHPRLRQLVEALVQLIDNEDTRPPATVGIYGPWGSGKSSVMQALRHELLGKHRYITVWFNPWRFHREADVAAALLQSVVNELREHMGLGRFEVAFKALGSRRALVTLSWMLPLGGLSCYFAGGALPKVVSALLAADFDIAHFNLETVSAMFGGGTLVTAVAKVATKLSNVFGVSPADLVKARSTEKSVDFFQRFTDDLQRVTDALPRKQEVVMFIDDLDRCPPEQVVAVLEAINLLAESKRIYLVLALDPRLVSRAIEMQRRDMLELMEKRGEPTADYGARFLEKIVTLPVQVPVVSAAEIEQTTTASAKPAAAASSRVRRVLEFLQRDERAVPAAWVLVTALALVWLSGNALWTIYEERAELGAAIAQRSDSAANKADQKTPAQANGNKQPPSVGAAETGGEGATAAGTKGATHVPDQGAIDAPRAEGQARSPSPTTKPSSIFRRQLHAPATSSGVGSASWAQGSEPGLAPYAPDAAIARGKTTVRDDSLALGLLLALSSFIAIVLELRRRSQRDVPPRVHDSPEFGEALRTYLAELPPNPRNVIRRANRARLLYQLEGRGRSVEAFFAGLVAAERAERLRASGTSLNGDPKVTRFLLTRAASAEFPEASTPFRVLSSFPPSKFERVDQSSLPEVHAVSQSLKGWIVDTAP